jgi:hypothetical protein
MNINRLSIRGSPDIDRELAASPADHATTKTAK